jgi:hypothetical protein
LHDSNEHADFRQHRRPLPWCRRDVLNQNVRPRVSRLSADVA